MLLGLKEEESLDTREEPLAGILDAAARKRTRKN
jgi:hypothetical protein